MFSLKVLERVLSCVFLESGGCPQSFAFLAFGHITLILVSSYDVPLLLCLVSSFSSSEDTGH